MTTSTQSRFTQFSFGTVALFAGPLAFLASAVMQAEQPKIIGDGAAVSGQRAVIPPTVVQPVAPAPYRTPNNLIFVTPDRDAFGRLYGRVRVVPLPRRDSPDLDPRETDPPEKELPQGIVDADGADNDRDKYVEYFDNGHYVAELKKSPTEDDQPPRLTIAGTVRAMETIRLENQKLPHLMLRVEGEAGKNSLVDVGIAEQFRDVNIEIGDVIKATAQLGSINETPALIADDVVIDGKAIRTVR